MEEFKVYLIQSCKNHHWIKPYVSMFVRTTSIPYQLTSYYNSLQKTIGLPLGISRLIVEKKNGKKKKR